jgi:hypothetical protein
MTARRLGRDRAARVLRDVEQPEAIGLAMALAAAATFGWLATPFGLAVAIGVQLAVGGLGAVWLIGPAQVGLGLARYATLAVASVALTLFGRLIFARAGVLLPPVAAILLYGVLWLELRVRREGNAGLLLDLALVGIVFAAAAGVAAIEPADAWPPRIVLLVLLAAVPALRAAEARGRSGAEAVGQGLLHLLAVAQVGAALALMALPGLVGAAIVALAFHAWGGAAEALEEGGSVGAVALEFGTLALIGLAVALLLYSR